VEQWQKEDQNTTDLTTPTTNGQSFFESTSPLCYVMTVLDDLYCHIVLEMSYAIFPLYFGFFKCCHKMEHVDIKVLALAILFVILFVLFIITMVWPMN
jgi:hypothetical protein